MRTGNASIRAKVGKELGYQKMIDDLNSRRVKHGFKSIGLGDIRRA